MNNPPTVNYPSCGVRAFPSSRRQWTCLQQLYMMRTSQKHTSSRKSVKTSTSASDGNHIKVLSTSVIGAVDHSTGRETKGHSELVSSSTTTSYSMTTPLSKHTTLRSHSCDICDGRLERGPNPILVYWGQQNHFPDILFYTPFQALNMPNTPLLYTGSQ